MKRAIILISPEYWGRNFVSKHHYAVYLSEKYEVFFIEPPSAWTWKALFLPKIRRTEINGHLHVISMPNILPKLNYLPKWIQYLLFKIQAIRILNFLKIKQPDIVWSFTPMIYWNLNIWGAKHKIYHTVDFHPAKFEEDTCKSADVVISVTDLISEPIKEFNPKLYKFGHGADIRNFEKGDLTKVKLPGNQSTKVGYVGNFHRHIDYSLLERLAKKYHQLDFIMVGPLGKSNLSHFNTIEDNDLERLKKLPNVFFTDAIPSEQLMNYLLHFDINLVIFKDDKKIIHCNPHKMMGYFYAGGVTVSNFLDEYKDKRDLLLMADHESEIEELFTYAVSHLEELNNDEHKTRRRAYAIKNSYANIIEKIEKLLVN